MNSLPRVGFRLNDVFMFGDGLRETCATFPENISHPDNPKFKIMDLGKGRRMYSPLRILQEMAYDLNNEDLMIMTDDQFTSMIDDIKKELK